MQRKSTLCAAREALTALKCSNFEASTGICIDSHNSRILTCACYSNPPNTYFALTPQILTKHLHLNSPNNHAIFEDPPKCCDAVALCARNKTPKRLITDPRFFLVAAACDSERSYCRPSTIAQGDLSSRSFGPVHNIAGALGQLHKLEVVQGERTQ